MSSGQPAKPKDLDFERAAELRDEIASMKKLLPDMRKL